jgi:hypothetical protein
MSHVIQNLQDRALRVDTFIKMSNPPEHLSGRTLFPGALLALMVVSGALFALAVVIAVKGDGPARLWLDGGGSTVNLQANGGAGAPAGSSGVPASPISLLIGAPATGRGAAITLAAPSAAQLRASARLRGNAQVRRRTAARTPAASRPNQSAPVATASPVQGVSQAAATPAPVATAAPGSTVVKSRGRTTSPGTSVPKQRVSRTATPAPSPSATQAPAARSAPAPAETPTRVASPTLDPVAGVVKQHVYPGG